MFTLPKTTFERELYVYANHVQEQLGENTGLEPTSYLPAEAIELAESLAFDKQTTKMEADLRYKKSVISFGKGWVYTIRGIFDAEVKSNLASHIAKIHDLEMDIEYQDYDEVEVEYLPDDIEFDGTLLAIGTEIYRVDPYSADFRTSTITSYSAYSTSAPLVFENTGQFNINSISFEEGKDKQYQYAMFLDKQEAEEYLKEVIKGQMLEMQEKLKQLGE